MGKEPLEERLGRLERNQKRLIKLWEENLKIASQHPLANTTSYLEIILSEMELGEDETNG